MADTQPETEIIAVPNTLKPLVGDGPSRLPKEEAERLDAMVEAERPRYLRLLEAEIKAMRDLAKGARGGDGLDYITGRRIFAIAHRVRGEAGMNGYLLVGMVADLLCDWLDRPADVVGHTADFVRLHIDAMAAIMAGHVLGDGGEQGRELVEGFRQARSRLLK